MPLNFDDLGVQGLTETLTCLNAQSLARFAYTNRLGAVASYEAQQKPVTQQKPVAQQKPATLLVLQMDNYDWPAIFKGFTLKDGRKIRVIQTGWEQIHVHCDTYSSARLCVEITKLAPTASLEEALAGRPATSSSHITVQPDFVLIRNEVKMANFDGRSRLDGFFFADLPAVNSLHSVNTFCSRAAMQGYLHRLNRLLGAEAFPVMKQHFASSSRSLMYGYTFPAVVKVGSAHAGVGKMKITDHHQMSDFRWLTVGSGAQRRILV